MLRYFEAVETWRGSHASSARAQEGGAISVLTWNIEWSLRVPEATSVIDSLGLRLELDEGFDLILVQEMDEVGTEQLAKSLGLNHVYATAGVLPRTGRHFGNAILSPWPIGEPTVTGLPHPTYVRRQMRNVLAADVHIAGTNVRAYSTHAETPRILWRHRVAQFERLAKMVASDGSDRSIVAGDFNTVNGRAIATLSDRLRGVGLDRVSPDDQPTFRRFGTDFTLDHIFVGGLSMNDGAVEHPRGASDHHPIWVELNL